MIQSTNILQCEQSRLAKSGEINFAKSHTGSLDQATITWFTSLGSYAGGFLDGLYFCKYFIH